MVKINYEHWREVETNTSEVYTRHRAKSKEPSSEKKKQNRDQLDVLMKESSSLCREIISSCTDPIKIQSLSQKK